MARDGTAGFAVQRGGRGAKGRIEGLLVDVDADADDGIGHCAGFCFGLNEDAARFARTEEQVVGPAQIGGEAGGFANGMGGGESGGERQKRRRWRG